MLGLWGRELWSFVWDVFVCALMRVLAATASLPCMLHPWVVTFCALRLLSMLKRMCCNATSMFFRGDNAGAGSEMGCVCVFTDARTCRKGQSPVLIASYCGHILSVEALIRANADVLQCDK